jgi:UDP-N-acetylglucosamine:LPS N-acetylglucosamine transferase
MKYGRQKILAIASKGGHWTQLMRLKPAFEEGEIVYVSTDDGYRSRDNDSYFYTVTDANRWTKVKLVRVGLEIFKIICKERPSVVISTGAAPGLLAIIFGKLFGARTIWVDSIANAEKISMSGRIAVFFVNLHMTQWPHLAKDNKIIFKGNVIL